MGACKGGRAQATQARPLIAERRPHPGLGLGCREPQAATAREVALRTVWEAPPRETLGCRLRPPNRTSRSQHPESQTQPLLLPRLAPDRIWGLETGMMF